MTPFFNDFPEQEQKVIKIIKSIYIMDSMGKTHRYTTIPVRKETLDKLKGYKVGGASYDDLINDLLEVHPPEEFFLEHLRRLRGEKRRTWDEIREDLGL